MDTAAVTHAAPADESWLLRETPFRRYWLARVLSQTAQGALLYGLLILIVDQTSSSIWSSLFVICSIIPSLLLGLVGGAVADRLPQRALLIFLNLLRAAVVAALIWRDRDLTLVFTVTLAIWSVHQFYAPAESAFLAHVVPAARFGSASSLSNLALSLAQLLGMVLLAPLLLKLERPLVLFALCSLLFIAAAALLMRMGQVKRSPTIAELSAREPRPVDVSLRAGWRAALQDPVAFAALLDWVLIGVGLSTLVVIVPQYLERVLDTSSENTVYVFAPAAIGLVLGLQVAPFFGRLLGFGRLATIGLVAFAIAVGLMGFVERVVEVLGAERFPLATLEAVGIAPNVGATMLISIPAGFAVSLVTVSARTELMLRMPEEVRARVFATQMTLGNLAALAPALLAGVLVDVLGVAPVAVVVALTLVTGALYGRRLGGRLRAASQAPAMTASS